MMIEEECQQDRVQVDDDRGVRDKAEEQHQVIRSKRNREPYSKNVPVVYDLDLFEVRRIPMSGKKNGNRGCYWPQ